MELVRIYGLWKINWSSIILLLRRTKTLRVTTELGWALHTCAFPQATHLESRCGRRWQEGNKNHTEGKEGLLPLQAFNWHVQSDTDPKLLVPQLFLAESGHYLKRSFNFIIITGIIAKIICLSRGRRIKLLIMTQWTYKVTFSEFFFKEDYSSKEEKGK